MLMQTGTHSSTACLKDQWNKV